MDLILTGRMIDAQEAYDMGLINGKAPADELLTVASETAKTIAGYARDITMMARAHVNAADENSLENGVRCERQMYHALFGSSA